MKIAVIGASGFIGTRLIERFHLGGGPTVIAVVRQPRSLALPARFALEFRLADALDPAAIARALSGCAAVVHAALGDPRQIEQMPAALCRGAAAAGVRRVIYLSTASVHGQNPAPGTDETAALHARHSVPYNNAKVRAERSFFAACHRHGLAGFALRPGIVYGPRSRWIAGLATDLIERRAWLYAEGRGICNAIYVDNLVDAISGCLSADDEAAGPFLVGDQETVTWADFYRHAADQLHLPWADIHQVAHLPAFRRTWSERRRHLVAQPLAQRLLPLVPDWIKRGTKAMLANGTAVPAVDAWAIPAPPRPKITQEMALLQQCAWKFPQARAELRLNYRPAVAFADGMERSFAWWRFARGQLAPGP